MLVDLLENESDNHEQLTKGFKGDPITHIEWRTNLANEMFNTWRNRREISVII